VAIAIATFEIYGKKFTGTANFNMLFQLVQTKFFKSELFWVSQKVITRSTNAKGLLSLLYQAHSF